MIDLLNNKLYFGVVESTSDPEEKGRIQCRIIGLHTEDKSLIPTDALPWCNVMTGSSNAFISGVGYSPVGVVEGTLCVLISMQPDNLQEFLILGVIAGNRQSFINSGFGFNDPTGTLPTTNDGSDINVLARGKILSTSPLENQSQNTSSADVTGNTSGQVTIDPALAKKIPWFAYAQKEIGVTEESNPARIKTYLKYAGFNNANVSTPWCSAFIAFCMSSAGIPHKTNGLARSWLTFGSSVALANAPVGSVVIIKGNRGQGSGHVAFLAEKWNGGATRVALLGGNQTYIGGTKTQTGGRVSVTNFKTSEIVDIRFPVSV